MELHVTGELEAKFKTSHAAQARPRPLTFWRHEVVRSLFRGP